jgi:isoquinoline 1-oxidoreductase alpha subunit
MAKRSFVLNGQPVTVEIDGDVRLLWVLRDVLGVTGPKYGCGLGACRACTSHLNGEAFTPCTVRVGDLGPSDHVTTIEGLADTVDADLHPVQEAWLDHDVAQCGYCQPGQIMTVAALTASRRRITDADIDEVRNICRCGTYSRIRQAIRDLERRPTGG